jgi:hypothetical protein
MRAHGIRLAPARCVQIARSSAFRQLDLFRQRGGVADAPGAVPVAAAPCLAAGLAIFDCRHQPGRLPRGRAGSGRGPSLRFVPPVAPPFATTARPVGSGAPASSGQPAIARFRHPVSLPARLWCRPCRATAESLSGRRRGVACAVMVTGMAVSRVGVPTAQPASNSSTGDPGIMSHRQLSATGKLDPEAGSGSGTLPGPGRSSSSIRPPCCSTYSLTIAKPNPLPRGTPDGCTPPW